jgi:hypothetical protein
VQGPYCVARFVYCAENYELARWIGPSTSCPDSNVRGQAGGAVFCGFFAVLAHIFQNKNNFKNAIAKIS